MAKKTDNHNPEAKLKLRRYFLEKYHAHGSAKVFDCCQGCGVMWETLRRTHPVASYWGVDLKPKKGRVKIDSVRILQQPGMVQDVIDIDTYGSPWKHWLALLPNVTKPTTVFLTIGMASAFGIDKVLSSEEQAAIGLLPFARKAPASLLGKVSEVATRYVLLQCQATSEIKEAVEAPSNGNARYIGVRLEPK